MQTAIEIAKAVRDKRVSVVEVVAQHLRRIETHNPLVNAVVQVCGERAMQEASAADQAIARGDYIGVLHGVPFTIKDSLDTEGVITTGGTQGRANYIPAQDATVVARLRQAGGVLLGKTNTPELTMCGDTDNELYGRTNNPYDLTRSSGGSSGGSAAAVACGFAAFDIGSDTGGSVREPAHFCGLAAHKPSVGVVPRTGHIIPWGMGAVDSLTHIGPLARCIDDIALILPIIAGPDWIDPSIVPIKLNTIRDVDVRKLRIAYYADNGIVELHPHMRTAMSEVFNTLQDDGLHIETALPSAMTDASNIVGELRGADGGAMTRRLLKKVGTDKPGPNVSACLQGTGVNISGEQYSEILEQADEVRSRMLGFFKDYDAIVCPVSFGAARNHGDSLTDQFPLWSYASVYNLTGWPASVVRISATRENLPLGVQVVAGPWRDDVSLALAKHIERLMGGFVAPKLHQA